LLRAANYDRTACEAVALEPYVDAPLTQYTVAYCTCVLPPPQLLLQTQEITVVSIATDNPQSPINFRLFSKCH